MILQETESKDTVCPRTLQSVELELLKALIHCCDELGLKYYLIGGTLLGAVRHHGFIPWDDDIDVGMPRADYELFLHNAQPLLPEYYFVQCRDTDPELLISFAKLRDSRTTFIESSTRHRRINHGVYIDIFPLDNYPETAWKQSVFDFRLRMLSLRIRSAFALREENKKNAVIEFGMKAASALMSIRYPKAEDALEAREKLYRSVAHSSLLANLGGAWGKKEIAPAEWFGEGVKGMFEGLRTRLPSEYDKWLKQVYGDYLQLPPPEKRVVHHYTDVIDLDRSYTEYMREKTS